MKILAIETSSHVASVAVLEDHMLLGEFTVNHPKTHSQKLMPLLQSLLESLELKVSEMDYLAVSEGPGSFTGVRIGLSAVKGLAHPHNIPIIQVSSLEAMVQPFAGFDGWICPLMDARRNEIYTGLYGYGPEGFFAVMEEVAVEPLAFVTAIKEAIEEALVPPSKVMFLGDGLPKYEDQIKAILGDSYMAAPEAYNRQRAASVAQLALVRLETAVGYDGVHANYMRKSEAETTYEEKQRVK